MLSGLFDKLKSMVMDENGIKWGNIITAGAGAAAGAFLLGPAVGLGAIPGALLGGAATMLIKEVVLPMIGIGGNRSAEATPPAQGFTPVRQQTQQVAMDEPSPGNIPGRSGGRQIG
jgi:hypothetical protein